MRTFQRERAVLTDSELAVYLAWTHPDPKRRLAVLERQTMAAVSRIFGGVRTGDLHAMKWEHFGPDFGYGIALRRKTARPQRIVVPEALRAILRAWHDRSSNPSTGLVFPCLRGEHAGKGSKTRVSHAAALRRDLARAFGLEVWDPMACTFVPARPMTPRELELLVETEFTRPVDFHSFRRAFCQSLAATGLNAQSACALAGHASLSAHERYLRNTTRTLEIPAAAVPQLSLVA